VDFYVKSSFKATLDRNGVTDFFAKEFGLDERETVALMGAHSIGALHKENSGYNGAWKEEASDN